MKSLAENGFWFTSPLSLYLLLNSTGMWTGLVGVSTAALAITLAWFVT